jgi:hypothetical protein
MRSRPSPSASEESTLAGALARTIPLPAQGRVRRFEVSVNGVAAVGPAAPVPTTVLKSTAEADPDEGAGADLVVASD